MPPRQSKTKRTAEKSQEPPSFELYCAVVQFVFKHGAESLHEAFRQKKGEIVRELFRAGVDVNTIWKGKTVLTEAIERDDVSSMEELIAVKADPCARFKDCPSGLHVACEEGKREMAEKMLAAGGTKGIDDLYKDENKNIRTALMAASCRGDEAMVETLIAGKADVNKCSTSHQSAALLAAKGGKSTVLGALLKAGADVHRGKDGLSLVYLAAFYGHTDCLRLLIEAKACVLTPDQNRDSPLMQATSREHTEAMRLLIEAKADANVPNELGNTALHLAALRGHDEAIKVLVMEGQAKLDVKNKCGQTPLQWTQPGSSTHALLTEMEMTGADEHVLVKSAAKRFKPLVIDDK